MKYWIALILPFFISLLFYIREYGATSFTREYASFRSFKLLGPLLLALHAYILYSEGPTWFCGRCYLKGQYDSLMLLSFGSSAIAFAPLFSGAMFDNALERLNEFLLCFFGGVLLVIGWLLAYSSQIV